MNAFLGLRVVESSLVGGEPFWRGHPDWRERLARNLARRSASQWEPLADYIVPPDAVMIDNTIIGSPRVVAALYNLAKS